MAERPDRHLVLRTGSKRCIIVGDVHGSFRELQTLLKGVLFSADNDVLILAGDLVGKGADSHAVAQFAKEFCHAVLGNWDLIAIDLANRPDSKSAQKPKHAFVKQLSSQDIAYLATLPYTITLPDVGALVVHAGIMQGAPLHSNTASNMTEMRSVSADGSWSDKASEGRPWAQLYSGAEHIYFGHDAGRGLQLCAHATGLDTNCCGGGALTAAVLQPGRQRELWSVDSVLKGNATPTIRRLSDPVNLGPCGPVQLQQQVQQECKADDLAAERKSSCCIA